MRKLRFFVPKSNIDGENIKIDGQEFRHLYKVLRQGVGAKVTVICNDGVIRECEIMTIHRDYAIASVLSQTTEENVGADITVYQALIKSDPMSYAVQKCTELGIKRYIPYNSEYSVIVDKGQIKSRLERIAESSCKQCGRVSSMVVGDTQNFDDILKDLPQYDIVIVPYEKDTTNAKTVLSKLKSTDKIAVIIGSEGGFSPNEIQKLKTLDNVSFVSLGRLILRADTAVISIVSAIKYEVGEFTNENINVDTGV